MAEFSNQATLSYTNGTIKSNIITGQLLSVLSAFKSTLSSQYAAGGRVTYIISLINAGKTNYTNLTVTDNLGAYMLCSNQIVPLDYVPGSILCFTNGALQSNPNVIAGPPLVISGISVPACGNTILIYETEVNDTAPIGCGGCIVNTATVAGAGLSAPIYVSNTVFAESKARLTISKSICPCIVVENETLTYTFIIQNTGNVPVTASDNVVITDTFNPVLSNICVTLGGAPLKPTTGYTYNTTTGAFKTATGVITVPAAQFTQDPVTGAFTTIPGVNILTVKGTV